MRDNKEILYIRKLILEQIRLIDEQLGVPKTVENVVNYLYPKVIDLMNGKVKGDLTFTNDKNLNTDDLKVSLFSIELRIDNSSSEIMSYQKLKINKDNQLFSKLIIYKKLNDNELKDVLSHEITHMYEDYQKISKSVVNNPVKENIYDIATYLLKDNKYSKYDDFNYIIYLTDNSEMNALITEFYSKLQQIEGITDSTKFLSEVNKINRFKFIKHFLTINPNEYIHTYNSDLLFKTMIDDIYCKNLNYKFKNGQDCLLYLTKRINNNSNELSRKIYRLLSLLKEKYKEKPKKLGFFNRILNVLGL